MPARTSHLQSNCPDKPPSKSYIGSCATTFKTRYNNHKQSFKHIKHRNDTALSKFIWKLKEANTDFTLSWSIVSSVSKNFCKGKTCHLCLTEKAFIIKEDPVNALNTRGEILNKCRHRNKFKLKKIQEAIICYQFISTDFCEFFVLSLFLMRSFTLPCLFLFSFI